VETEKLKVSMSYKGTNLIFDVESKEDLNLTIECLEMMYKKSGLVTIPTLTDAQSHALNMITPIGESNA